VENLPEFERQIDLRGNLLMPGFKNAHTHTAMTFLRSYADGQPLQKWLFESIFPMEDKLTPEDIYDFTKLGILEYLSGGITASFDMYYMRDAYVQANLDCGFRTCICGGSAKYELISAEYKKFNSIHPLIRYIPGLHAEYTASDEEFQAAVQLCRENKAPCFAHNSETKSETEQCRQRRGGLSPTEYMESLGLFDYGGGGFHCVWLSREDIEIFRRRGLWVVSCPGSNAKLASGIAPLGRFMDEGLNIALGTDGASSNNALDMFREMYLACVLQKLQSGDAAACPADRVLDMACRGGALAMGLSNCDSIAVGKQADMIVIDLDRPEMQPLISPAKNLVYSGSRDAVALTMIAGRVLYEKGEFFIGEDVHEIYARCQQRFERMAEQ
jgi:5-methylthioadenosine/S-adenosylhomocysteine deaminase